MRYQPILIFAGAGASAPFGVPVMKVMTTRLEEPTSAGLPGHLQSLLRPVATSLREIYSKEYDLEKLLDVVHDLGLGYTTDASIRESSPHAAFRYHQVTSNADPRLNSTISAIDSQFTNGQSYIELEQAISTKISEWCAELDTAKSSQVWRDFLVSLPSGLVDGKGHGVVLQYRYSPTIGRNFPLVSFATTNYDLAFEELLAGARLEADTGFRFNRQTNVEEFQLTLAESDALPLLKLHGSVDWWKTDDHRTVRLMGGKANLRLKDGARLVSRDLKYPVVTKSLGGLPFSSLYARLAEAMDTAVVWLFIGYAFGDQSIVELVSGLLSPEKRLIVVSPHASALNLARHVLPGSGQITSVDASFGEPDLMTRINEAIQGKQATR